MCVNCDTDAMQDATLIISNQSKLSIFNIYWYGIYKMAKRIQRDLV